MKMSFGLLHALQLKKIDLNSHSLNAAQNDYLSYLNQLEKLTTSFMIHFYNSIVKLDKVNLFNLLKSTIAILRLRTENIKILKTKVKVYRFTGFHDSYGSFIIILQNILQGILKRPDLSLYKPLKSSEINVVSYVLGRENAKLADKLDTLNQISILLSKPHHEHTEVWALQKTPASNVPQRETVNQQETRQLFREVQSMCFKIDSLQLDSSMFANKKFFSQLKAIFETITIRNPKMEAIPSAISVAMVTLTVHIEAFVSQCLELVRLAKEMDKTLQQFQDAIKAESQGLLNALNDARIKLERFNTVTKETIVSQDDMINSFKQYSAEWQKNRLVNIQKLVQPFLEQSCDLQAPYQDLAKRFEILASKMIEKQSGLNSKVVASEPSVVAPQEAVSSEQVADQPVAKLNIAADVDTGRLVDTKSSSQLPKGQLQKSADREQLFKKLKRTLAERETPQENNDHKDGVSQLNKFK